MDLPPLPYVSGDRLLGSTDTVFSLTPCSVSRHIHAQSVCHNTVFDTISGGFYRVVWSDEGDTGIPSLEEIPDAECRHFPGSESFEIIATCSYRGNFYMYVRLKRGHTEGYTAGQPGYLWVYQIDTDTWTKHTGPPDYLYDFAALIGYKGTLFLFQSMCDRGNVSVDQIGLDPIEPRRWERRVWTFPETEGDSAIIHDALPFVLSDELHVMLPGQGESDSYYHLVLKGQAWEAVTGAVTVPHELSASMGYPFGNKWLAPGFGSRCTNLQRGMAQFDAVSSEWSFVCLCDWQILDAAQLSPCTHLVRTYGMPAERRNIYISGLYILHTDLAILEDRSSGLLPGDVGCE
ncbi:hypothetical protein KIPB_007686 [Kipferlia bialata]|uniref:Uncharacterized protein n=1 Tax=Kipferlia bialata TaxID=797122 RepID=A0A9K3GKQ6_9EUKA|nr:hypothetical protein KIPB_007686 [Kipferlia bialata]|eukprot:g7686.t1